MKKTKDRRQRTGVRGQRTDMGKSVIEQIAIKRLSVFTIRHSLFAICYLLFAICYPLFPIPCLYGAFEENMPTARSSALGGRTLAYSDNSSILFNPAGLSFNEGVSSSFGYRKLHLGISDGSGLSSVSALVGGSLRNFGFGVAYTNLALDDIYEEELISLSGSYSPIKYISFGIGYNFYSIGITLDNYLRNDPLFSGGYLRSFGEIKFGALIRASGMSIGYSSGYLSDENRKYKNPEPTTISVMYEEEGFLLGVEHAASALKEITTVGFEKYLLKDIAAIRTGFSFGGNGYRKVSAGAGLRIQNIGLDYAFRYPLSGMEGTSGSHQLTLSVHLFGAPVQKKEKVVKMPPMVPAKVEEKKEEYEKVMTSTQAVPVSEAERPESVTPLHLSPLYLGELGELPQPKPPVALTEPLKVEISTPSVIIPTPPVVIPTPPVITERRYRVVERRPSLPAARTHKVLPEETLQSISEKYYGIKNKWHQIYEENKEKIEKGIIRPGEVLIIP